MAGACDAAAVFNEEVRTSVEAGGYQMLHMPLAPYLHHPPHEHAGGGGCEFAYNVSAVPSIPRGLVRWDGIHLNQGLVWHWWHQALARARCVRGDQAACAR